MCSSDLYQVGEDDTLIVAAPGILGNDSDLEGATLTPSLVSVPAHGSLTLNTDGSFTYVPVANYNGPDSFSYRVSDGTLQSGIATVSIDVVGVQGASDFDLYVKTVGVKLNWADVNRDSLTLRGQINPRGIKDNLTGATINVRINGQPVFGPMSQIFFVASVALFAGNLAFIVISGLAGRRPGQRGVWASALLLPAYWVLISLAAWKGL